MTTPAVSIGLPVYNGEAFLARALDSLLAQTFADFEIVVSDNASTDATAEICAAYAERDPRIRYHRHARNGGAAANYNFTVEMARGAYFKWMAHDDLVAPGFLQTCMDAFARAPESVVLSFTKVCWVGVDDECVAADGDGVPPEQRDVGMVFQEFALFPHLSVAENVAFGLEGTVEENAERVTELLDLVEAVDPEIVYTTHGFTREFATELTRRGYAARALEANQATLGDFSS